MRKEFILAAQNYLITEQDERKKRIIDLEPLFKNHDIQEVIEFLGNYEKEKQEALKNMLVIDKASKRVDEMIAAIFRVHTAIDILKTGKEVKTIGATKQGAGKSGKFQRRYRRRYRCSWKRQDKNHDGKNRYSGQKIQRAA